MASGFSKKTPTPTPPPPPPPRSLLREKLASVKLFPSTLLREKFLNMKNVNIGRNILPRTGQFLGRSETGQKLSSVAPKKSMFQVSPSEMVFQNFVGQEISVMDLSLMNTDKRRRVVNVSMRESPYFQLVEPSDVCRVVPPGMSVHVRVRFTPEENKDYSHELVCSSERELIVVPIRATATHPILDFPDQLDFFQCPVKCSNHRTLLVHNTGNGAAHYQLRTQSPFSVVPAEGILGAGHTMQVTVGFHPLTSGGHFGSLVVRCTGEKSIHTNLQGKAVDVNIEMNTNFAKVEKTFINMSKHATVFIRNRSNITAQFQWKAFPSEEDENEKRRRQCDLLQPSPKVWLQTFLEQKRIEREKGFCENRVALLDKKAKEEIAKVQEDPMLFSDDIFSIEPIEGEIGPYGSAEIKVTFKPREALEYQSVAYCDISGRESRLALRLRGEGRGPLVELSCGALDLGNVGRFYMYFHFAFLLLQVKLINQGPIDAPFTYIPSTSKKGCCFGFVPKEGLIAPGGIQTIRISFKATMLGRFEEPFQFRVAGSPTPVILTIKGCVTEQTLHFDTDELDFGDISFGFPYTKTCRLTNTSRVPLTFKLRVSDDGTQPAVSCFDQIRSDSDPSWREGIHFSVLPREFTMNPSQGIILPQEHQDIEVTLCSNTVMEFYRKLLVDLEWFGRGVASLIIKARCFVPELRVYPQILWLDECNLKVPLERKFFIWNNTHLPGCYGLIPQEPKEDSPVLYSSPKPCGIVQPRSAAEIPVTVEIQTLGKHCTNVCIGVFGDARNPLRTELRSLEWPSEIYPSPRVIEFGKIPALTPNSQSFTLFNEGHVDVDFRLEIVRKPHCCVTEPKEGVIPARGEVPVTVTVTLDDTGFFADGIQLFIGNKLWTTSILQAFGTGSTIVFDKPFAPELNLGYQFSLVPCIRRFKLTNSSHHFHRLFWKVECNRPAGKEGQSTSARSSPKAEDDSQRPKRTAPVFGLGPLSMDLKPGESVDMMLRGFSCQPQVVQNYVRCEAVIETGSMMKIIETIITCEFINPSIEISARQFSFQVEKKPSDVLTLQYQPLAIKNTCRLPLDLMLYLEQPFQVCSEDQQSLPYGQPVTVDVGQTCHLYIAFDPAYRLDFNSWKVKKILKIEMVRGHPYVEYITLQGEAHFPSLRIQPSTLEFGCIVDGTKKERSLEMTNCSSLPVKYFWSLQVDDHVKKLRHELCPPKLKPRPPQEKPVCLDKLGIQWRHFKIRKAEEPATALEESRDLAQSSGPEVPPHAREKCLIRPGLGGFRHSVDLPHISTRVEKAFSILPVSGVLQPGETQQVSFTFFGRLNTIAGVRALCQVEGGPTYKVKLTGEASRVSYLLSSREIDCGAQMFNEIHHATVTLENTCKIKFNWVLNPSTADQDLPGVFLVKPTRGSVAPGKKQVLNLSYMPGLPGAFSRTYQLKVGDLEPEYICLKGEASFPMLTVNLPWNIKGNEKFKKALEWLEKLQQQRSQKNKSVLGKKTPTSKTETSKTRNQKTQNRNPSLLGSGNIPAAQLQKTMVSMVIEKAALDLQRKLPSHLPKSTFPDSQLFQSLVNIELPEYVLDMGSVLQGFCERRTLEITNPGQMFVFFQMDVSVLQDTGFSVFLDQMEGLAPTSTMTFEVFFESACCPQGDVDVLLPIKVAKGPTSHIRLRAAVIEASLSLSKNTLQFSDTVVGQCQTETVRLYNWYQVPCSWYITAVKPVRKSNQRKCRTPALHQKKQALEDEPCPFEVMPSEGTLDAGSWQDLKIQFTPKKEKSYKNELKLNIRESSNHLKLHLSGQGLEPQLEFSPPALEMGWVLVDSDGVEATVVVKNPCNFPIEFYSLDFDEQYLEEEKVLRMAVGSRYQKKFLMPPRAVGETLPPELLDYYEAQKRLKAQQGKVKAMAEAEAEAMVKAEPARHRAVPFCPEALVKATQNPISQAVLRHLGTDPSSESCGAQQAKGIVVILHGPPRAGKTEIAAALCHHYDAAPLSIDTVVKEAIANDGSQAGLRARELCTEAAMELESKNKGNAGEKPQLIAQTKNKQASGEKINKNAEGKSHPAQKKKEPASKPQWSTLQLTVSTAPAPQQLNITSSCGEELNCLSCVLPEDLLVEILCERLKHKDCYKGVVFDGLESLFASSLESSLLCVLRAVKNRRYIFVVNMHQDYASWKAKKEAERQKEELQREEARQRNRRMDEEEYGALPKEEKAAVDKIILERNHMWREREQKQLAQKLEEKEKQEEEERRKKKKKGVSLGKQPTKPEKGETKPPERKETKAPEKKTKPPEKKKTKIQEKKETKAPEQEETEIPEDPTPMEKNLLLRFQIYESSQQNVAHVFSYWDRVQGSMQLPVIQNGNKSRLSSENKGQKTNKTQEKMEKKPEQKCGDPKSLGSSPLETRSKVPAEGAVRDEQVGVPCLDIQVTHPKAMFMEILRSGRLPTEDQMLRHLGLHPEGPPLPPAFVLSVVNYPEERLGSAENVKLFTIEAPEGAAMEDDLAKAPDVKGSSARGQPKMGKAASRDNSPKKNHVSTQRAERPRDCQTRSIVPSSTATLCQSSSLIARLKRYRWIVPAHGEVELKVRFSTQKPGKFEQTLRFELVGTKRQYELPCSVTGLYPSISQDPWLVFPQWRKTMEADEIISKEYVESTKQFHFGPLLCGKSREWYKAQNCPSNSENITILNNSPMDIEVHFTFESYKKSETFYLDPPSMTLRPAEKRELTIWAYPTSPGFLEDRLICCIAKNPEPVVFSLCCHGVHVKLDVSPLELSFDKLCLHRTDSRTLVLKNDTLLPMAWQLKGLDDLVEHFSVSQDKGTIGPRSELEVTLNFKAGQIGSIEKTLQLEVSDTENMLGIVQAENIKVSAEVYDLPLSLDMPEGADGSLEFGTINVLDKVKKVLSLKNIGLYNIEYSFTLKGAGPSMQDLASHFSVEPRSGVLTASQPDVNIEMLFHPTSEIFLKNEPILYCQVIDGSSGEGGQIVTEIPVRVSARAVYTKYSTELASAISFGAMLKGAKKTQTVMLENKGTVNFKFCIHQAPKDASALESQSSKQGESAPPAAKRSTGRKLSCSTQGPLSLGMFTVSPCSGSVSPWGQQKITVECLAGQEGTCGEQLYIDITGRDPRDNPLGIPFTLTAESCLPAFVDDVMSVFGEHLICRSTDLSRKLLQSVEGVGLFVSDKNKFVFNKILVQQKAKAHFNIYNASSLSCDVVLSIRPQRGKDKSSINVFNLYPVKMSVPGSSPAVATVTFTPPDKKNYNCTFTASLVIPAGSVNFKPQILTFTISGKAHKPQVTVVCPSYRINSKNSLLRFRRLQLGESEMLPLVICNNGVIPVKFMLHLEDEHGAFLLKGRGSTLETVYTEDVEDDSAVHESKSPKKPFLLLHSGQSTKFDVIFKPTLAQGLEGRIHVLRKDKYSKKSPIKLIGEGHKDEFTLDGLEEDIQEGNAESILNQGIIDAVRVNHVQFGSHSVGKPCNRTFTITNHTCTKVMCFEWEANAPFQFSPKVGHLYPGCAKDITVTLKSDVPATFRRHLVKCKVAEINFELPGGEVQDWDDQMCIVTSKDTTRKDPAARWPEKRKVVKTVLKWAQTMVKNSQEAELYLSASVVYSHFKVNTILVQFKNTLPFRKSKSTFRMHNTGKVALEYSWEEAADCKSLTKTNSPALARECFLFGNPKYRTSMLEYIKWCQEPPFQGHVEMGELVRLPRYSEQQQLEWPEQQDGFQKIRIGEDRQWCLQNGSSLELIPDVQPLFSISPDHGIISPGKKQTFQVQFYPMSVGNFMTPMLCRIPNLEPTQKKAVVIVKGRAQERKRRRKPKCSVVQQAEKGQRPKNQVHLKPTPE
ncbi:LOW QUALITY PROTEIN: hydrocephalus-inducing protein homolog [Chamaea fasciata]|uniref:LOW QUALITY PROTEIN: hydrocephalus-inducing protein homolog n=1 Tax=Chamaea fasciata TaxID=190680 RepID=UPI00336ADFF6